VPSSSGLSSPRRINRVTQFLFPKARPLRVDMNDGCDCNFVCCRPCCLRQKAGRRETHHCLRLILFINKWRGINVLCACILSQAQLLIGIFFLKFTLRVLPGSQTVMAVRVGTNFACLHLISIGRLCSSLLLLLL
jgi:hypothetical protein